MSLLAQLFPDTAPGFVLVATTVCLFMAATVTVLMQHAERCEGRQRAVSALLVAAVAGVGVWTTHFVAMLGYRPDAMIGYAAATTLASALVGVALVGGPLALGCYARCPAKRAVLGGIAGAGVGAMHFSGMLALQGCSVAHAPGAVAIALASGTLAFAAGLGVPRRLAVARTSALILGVCALHFTAMAGVSLEVAPRFPGRTFDAGLLSMLVATASLALSIAAVVAIAVTRRLAKQRDAAATADARRDRILSLAMRNMSNGLVMVDAGGTVIAFNDRAVELNGLAAGELCEGQHFEEFLTVVGRHNNWDAEMLGRVIANHQAWIAKTEISHVEHRFDSGRVLRVSCRPMADGGAVLTFDDVTARHSAEAAMNEMAYHDALTGLPNRRSFNEAIATKLREGGLGGVLILDLDRFKTVNETLGHEVGDRLLVQVAERLGRLTACGRLYRLGGDELAALLPAPGCNEGRGEAQRLIGGFEAPFVVDGHRIRIGCSIGLACVEEGDDADLLFRKADLALYRAKGLGRNRVEPYEAGMMEQAHDRRQLEIDLERALREGQLFLQYQPLFGLPDRRLAGFEALVRWQHPVRGLVSPAAFVPLAEENGTIVEIGAWILEQACRQAARWPERLRIAVNVSVVEMRSPDIVDRIAAALKRHGLAPGRLELELTETAMVEDGARIAESLRALRRLGVRIAMDDFGTGYSSLAHLRQFEIDRIKIDRSFIAVVDEDREARAVVRAVLDMAREMSIVTTAEGVRSSEQLRLLSEFGCDAAQGFYLGRPLDREMADRLVCIQRFDDDAEADAGRGVTQLRARGA